MLLKKGEKKDIMYKNKHNQTYTKKQEYNNRNSRIAKIRVLSV